MQGKVYELIAEAKNQKVYEEAERLFCQSVHQRTEKIKELNRKTKEIKELSKKVEEWERQYKNIFREEMKPLLLEAEATAFKRTDEIREKIVALYGEEIISDEANITREYTSFMARPDFERIRQEFPQIVELKSEGLLLLQMAWQRKDYKTKPSRLTPDQWRQREINRMMIQAQDRIQTKLASLRSEIMESVIGKIVFSYGIGR